MHGVILDELRQYIGERYGYRAWVDTLKAADRPPTLHYSLDEVYPDPELGTLVASASAVTGASVQHILEGFGEAIVPDMMRLYAFLIEPTWGYTDFLLHMEPLLHQALQIHTPGAPLTKVQAERMGARAVRVVYNSPLRACAAVFGIMRGAAREYGVSAEIEQSRCVLRGDPECVFDVAVGRGSAAPAESPAG